MAALDRLPGVLLLGTDFFWLAVPPSDRGRIEQYLRASHRGEPCGFGEPLIPAYEHADRAARGAVRDEIKIAWGKIIFFVIAGIVGDMHLAVAADDFPGLIDNGGSVVINARRATLQD